MLKEKQARRFMCKINAGDSVALKISYLYITATEKWCCKRKQKCVLENYSKLRAIRRNLHRFIIREYSNRVYDLKHLSSRYMTQIKVCIHRDRVYTWQQSYMSDPRNTPSASTIFFGAEERVCNFIFGKYSRENFSNHIACHKCTASFASAHKIDRECCTHYARVRITIKSIAHPQLAIALKKLQEYT